MPDGIMLAARETSGNTQADRRFEYALQFAERGDHPAALDLLNQCLELTPDWPPPYFYKGLSHQALACGGEAIACFQQYRKLDSHDRLGAGIKLNLLGMETNRQGMPQSYVRALFDQYAPRFEAALTGKLNYKVPSRLYEYIEKIRPSTGSCERILDLGCGTGLVGDVFKGRAVWLEGVDLSPGMIDQAARKNLYHRLEVAELGVFLENKPDMPYDLIIAADVFVYLGALEAIMARLEENWLAPGGLLAFSVQKASAGDVQLGADHRFAHSRAYLEACIRAARLKTHRVEEEIIRKDGIYDLPGYLILCEKPAMHDGICLAKPLYDSKVE